METAEKKPTMEEHALASGSTFVWHEVYAADVQKAIEFYTKNLGFGTTSMDMGGEVGTYHMLTKNGKGVAGVMPTNMPGHEVPPHWSVFLAVDDVDARLEKCTADGASIVVPAMDVPTVGRMALISDSQGAHIWLYTPAEDM